MSSSASAPAPRSDLQVAELPLSSFPDAVGILARGMRDNPVHIAAYGPDPQRRERVHGKLMAALFRTARHNQPIGAWRDGTLVACTGVLLDHGCRPGPGQGLRMLPVVGGLGPRTAARVGAWLRVWAKHDPEEPHAHLGPLAVDRDLQGQGIGSTLMAEHCRRLDERGTLGYLETDKPENVRFYEKHGYRVVAQAPTIGVTSWFMRREP